MAYSPLANFPARGFVGPDRPSTYYSASQALSPTAAIVLVPDGPDDQPSVEPFMRADGVSMPYRVFGRSTPKALLTGCGIILIFYVFFYIAYVFAPWHPENRLTPLGYGVMPRSDVGTCPTGTGFQIDRGRCEVLSSLETAIDPSIMVTTADPCSSVYLYAAGGWDGAQDVDLRTFDSARRTVHETIPLLGSVASRSVDTTNFQDFVASCIRTAAHPNATSDALYVSGMLDELRGVGMENHTALFLGAYGLGRQVGMGISTLVSTAAAVNPRNTVQSLFFWDVGTMLRQMALVSDATNQWSFEEGCRTLAFLGRMDNVMYSDWRDCAVDMRAVMVQTMELAQDTAQDGEAVTYDYIQHTLETRDLYTRSELGRGVGSDFVNGYLTGVTASLSAFVGFLNAEGRQVPRVMSMKQWTMRRRYLAGLANLINATEPGRWSQFLAVTTVIFGMEVPLTLLHAPTTEEPPVQNRRFLDMSFDQAFAPPSPVVHPSQGLRAAPHMQWVHQPGEKRRARPTRAVDIPPGQTTGAAVVLTDMMKTEMTRACTLLALQYMERTGEVGVRNLLVSKATTQGVTGMAETLRDAFVNEIVLSIFIPAASKSPLALKMSEVAVVFGAPEDDIVPIGSPVDPDATVLSNIISMNRRSVAVATLGAVEHDGTTLPMRPAAAMRTDAETPSAYYDPTSNTVFVSTALLTMPFFYSGWSLVEQYATLGFVLARSMAKAIDTDGVMFSTGGSLDPILNDAGRIAHNTSIHALCEQYLSGQTPCAGLLPNEIFADVIGMNVVLRALESVGEGPSTPELRKFVVAFAQTWASARTTNVHQLPRVDGFMPAEVRVDRLATYMRTPEGVPVMRSAFQCPTGARLMQPSPAEVS